MKQGTPVFFKRKCTRPNTPTDAEYRRPMGMVQGKTICEIVYNGQKWIVRESEIKSEGDAGNVLMQEWKTAIVAVQEPEQFKYQLAKKLGISPATLRVRRKQIAEWEKRKNGKLDTRTTQSA